VEVGKVVVCPEAALPSGLAMTAMDVADAA